MKEAALPKKAATAKIQSTDDGLHLNGSILWLDSQSNGELSFLSSAALANSTKVPQVITTEETIKILEAKHKKKPNALICQYNRPFSIGKLKMELLPSGSILGGASLYVESDKGRILYAPQIQTQKISTVRQMQLKKAHTLIIGAFHSDPNQSLPNRKKEKDRLLEVVKSYVSNGQFPIIFCQPIATAQELTKLLSDEHIPLAVHPSIYRINRVYDSYGSQLGNYALYNPRFKKEKVVLFPLQNKKEALLRRLHTDAPLLLVEETIEQLDKPTVNDDFANKFCISSTCDGKDLREVINAVAPKEVYFFGPYAKRFSEEFKNTCKVVRPLFTNDQPTLF